MSIAILFVCFFGLAFLGVPIAVAIGIGVFGSVWVSDIITPSFIIRAMVNSVDSFTLTAIPFFVLAGHIMAEVGISRGLFQVANAFVGRLKGGVMIVTILACMAFGAISGSAYATVASIGIIALPELRKQGLSLGAAAALLATAGCLGQLIPPSTGLVVYGALNSVSISKLFAAEIIPGVFVGLMLCLYAGYYGAKHNIIDPNAHRYTFVEKLAVIWDAKYSLFMPIIMLGGIYTGMFTPTEAAAVSVAYGFVYGFLKKTDKLDVKKLPAMCYKTVITAATILFILSTSAGMSKILTLEEIPAKLTALIVGSISSRVMVLMILSLLVIFLGTFLDGIAINTVLGSILLGIALQYDVDPVYFGIIFVFNMTLGIITPPVGGNLFVSCQVCNASFEETVKSVWPWIWTFLIGLIIVICVPAMSLWIPSMMD